MVKNSALAKLAKKLNESIIAMQRKVGPSGIMIEPLEYISFDGLVENMKLVEKDNLSEGEKDTLARLQVSLLQLKRCFEQPEKDTIYWDDLLFAEQFATMYGFTLAEHKEMLITLLSYMKNVKGNNCYAELFGRDGKIKKTSNINALILFIISMPVTGKAFLAIVNDVIDMVSSFKKTKEKQYDWLYFKALMVKDLYIWNDLFHSYENVLSKAQIEEAYGKKIEGSWFDLYESISEQVSDGINSFNQYVAVKELVGKYATFLLSYKDGYVPKEEIKNFCAFFQEWVRETEKEKAILTKEQANNILITALEGLSMQGEKKNMPWKYFSLFLNHREIVIPNTTSGEKAFANLSSFSHIPFILQKLLLSKKKISTKKVSVQELFSIFKLRLSLDVLFLESSMKGHSLEVDVYNREINFANAYISLFAKEEKTEEDYQKLAHLYQVLKNIYQALEDNNYPDDLDFFYGFSFLCECYDISAEEKIQMLISIFHTNPFVLSNEKETKILFDNSAKVLFQQNGTIGETNELQILGILANNFNIPIETRLDIIKMVDRMIEQSKMEDKAIRHLGIILLQGMISHQEFCSSQKEIQENIFLSGLLKSYYGIDQNSYTKEEVAKALFELQILIFNFMSRSHYPISYKVVSFALHYLSSRVGEEEVVKIASYLLKDIDVKELIDSSDEELHFFGVELQLLQKDGKIHHIDAFRQGLEKLNISCYFKEDTLLKWQEKKIDLSKIHRKVSYYFDGKNFIRPITDLEEFTANIKLLYSEEEVVAILAKIPKEVEKKVEPTIFDVFSSKEQQFLHQIENIISSNQHELSMQSVSYQNKIKHLVMGLHTKEVERELLLQTELYQREGKLIYIADLMYLWDELHTRAELLLECEDEELRLEATNIMRMMSSIIEVLQPQQETKEETSSVVLLDDDASPCHILSDINTKDRREKKDTQSLLQKLESGLLLGDHTYSFKDLTYFSKVSGGKRAYYVKGPQGLIIVFRIILDKNAKKTNIMDKATYEYLSSLLEKLYADNVSFVNMMVEQMEVKARVEALLGDKEPRLIMDKEG